MASDKPHPRRERNAGRSRFHELREYAVTYPGIGLYVRADANDIILAGTAQQVKHFYGRPVKHLLDWLNAHDDIVGVNIARIIR